MMGQGVVLTSLRFFIACSLHRVLVEDGTGEALVLCRNQHVAAMLGLSLLEWEAVQSCVQSRGSLFIQYGEATGTGVSGLFRQGLLHAGCDFHWDWISFCCGCFRGSLPPSTHTDNTPFPSSVCGGTGGSHCLLLKEPLQEFSHLSPYSAGFQPRQEALQSPSAW